MQDDWRVTNRLTLNLGLRYEVETALVERDNKSVSGFDYDYVQPIQAAVQARYAALNDPALKALVPQLNVKGGLMFAGVDGGSALYTTPKNTFLPRVGFAYQLTPKTVIRGGAGLFAGFLGERRGDVISTGYSQTTTIGTVNNAFGAPIPRSWDTRVHHHAAHRAGRQRERPADLPRATGSPSSIRIRRSRSSSAIRSASSASCRAAWLFEAAYVGNYGYDIEITRNINALPIQYLNTDNSRTAAMNANNTFLSGAVANPFAGLLPGTSFNNATISRSQLLLPYPEFGDINTTNNDGKSWYNAGQFGLQKRFSKGYTLGVSYTQSKWMQATEYLNAADPTPTKMISDLDVTNRLSISGIYELPFGKGQKFGSDANAVTDAHHRRLADPGRLHLPDRLPRRRSGTTSSTTAATPAIPSDQQTTAKWFNTDVFTSILTDTGTTRRRSTTCGRSRCGSARSAGTPSTTSICRSSRPSSSRGPWAAVEDRVHQRLQRAVLPGPGRQRDVLDVRGGHGVEPVQLRPARAGRLQADVLIGAIDEGSRPRGRGPSFYFRARASAAARDTAADTQGDGQW